MAVSDRSLWKCSKIMNIVLQFSPFVYSQSRLKILSESMTEICIRSHQSLPLFLNKFYLCTLGFALFLPQVLPRELQKMSFQPDRLLSRRCISSKIQNTTYILFFWCNWGRYCLYFILNNWLGGIQVRVTQDWSEANAEGCIV